MEILSIGKLRGIESISDEKGVLRVFAIDQRGSLKKMVNPQDTKSVTFEQLRDIKLDLCRVLSPYSSATLLDPDYGAAQAVVTHAISGKTGLLVSLEKSGFLSKQNSRLTEILPQWSVEKIKRMGASAVKFLVYYNPDSDTAAQTRELVRQAAEECFDYDIACLVEVLVYPLDGDEKSLSYKKEKPDLVLRSAEDITGLGIDLYKAEFPLVPSKEFNREEAAELCAQLTEKSKVPWVILSAGMDFEIFAEVVEIACKAGASGYMAGRAIWKDAFKTADKKAQLEYLNNQGVANIKRLNEIASSYAKPWLESIKAISADMNWYRNYQGFESISKAA